MNQIPLQELHDPIMKMFAQINLYENLNRELEQRNKTKILHRQIIDKVLMMYEKKQELLQEQQQMELIYQQTNLTKEQANLLINLDEPVNSEFYRVYKILDQQEKLAQQIEKYDKDNSSILHKSLQENIQSIRQQALSKVIAHVKQAYDIIEIGELVEIRNLFAEQIYDQLIFVMRFKFSSKYAHLNINKTEAIFEFLKSYNLEFKYVFDNTFRNFELLTKELFIEEFTERFEQIIGNISSDYFLQLESTLKIVDNYQEIYEISILIESIQEKAKQYKNLDFVQILARLIHQCQGIKEKNLQILQHNLAKIRYNIAQLSSYQPIYEYFDNIKKMLDKYDTTKHLEITTQLYNPLMQMVKQKLQQNQYNRSSKIFSLNFLKIISDLFHQLTNPQITEFVDKAIQDNISFIEELELKICNENVKEVADSLKLIQLSQEIKKSSNKSSQQLKRIIKTLNSFEELNFRNELFFDLNLIIDQSQQIKIIKKTAQNFIDNFYFSIYSCFYEYISGGSDKKIEITQEIIEKLCQQHQITVKDVGKLPTYIRDPELFQLNIINMLSL